MSTPKKRPADKAIDALARLAPKGTEIDRAALEAEVIRIETVIKALGYAVPDPRDKECNCCRNRLVRHFDRGF